ncbi:MAG: sigma 54-interacting transcriptional regulator [Calditrichaceae bacterium]|nr:sigma 54-interacting transcriptional regulator [Calditrichaceae bacterium]
MKLSTISATLRAFSTRLPLRTLVPGMALLFNAALCSSLHGQPFPAPAQQARPRFEHLSVAEGLPENTVNWIIQDRLGFLWMSTQNGLVKYDGYAFTTYMFEPHNPQSLSDRNPMEILEDHLGNIWVGTLRGGLNRFNRASETFTHYRHDKNDPASLSDDGALTLYEDKTGALWVGTAGGLNRFDRRSGTFTRYRHDPDNPRSLSNDRIYAIREDHLGNFWIGTHEGLNQFERRSGACVRYLHDPADPASLSHNTVAFLYEDSSGILWVGSDGGGLSRFDRERRAFKHYRCHPQDPASLGSDRVYSILEDRSGNLWVGTFGGGLNRFERKTETFTRFRNSPNDPASISGDAIRFVFQDRSGVLWIGTFLNGLNKLDQSGDKFAHYHNVPGDPASLNNNRVWALHEDREGILWVGSDGGGLSRLDRQTGKFRAYTHDPADPHSVSNNYVGIIYEDRAGVLWIGAYGGGLSRFDRKKEIFTRYAPHPGARDSLNNGFIHAICEDSFGALWIGTLGGGLNKFDREKKVFTQYLYDPKMPQRLSIPRINAIREDAAGTLWIGSDGMGLLRYERAADSFTRFYDSEKGLDIILSIYEDRAGRFWIGTYRGGLHLFDRTSGTSVAFTEKDGLPHAAVKGILEDEAGNLWLGGERGLVKFAYEKRTFRTYDAADGLQGSHFNFNAACKGAGGALYFGGINGFNCFHPARLEDNLVPPPVALTGFKIFNRPVSAGERSPLPAHINVAGDPSLRKEIRLSYWQNDISLEYAALHFSRPEKNLYAFKLENYEEEWRQVGTQRSATYTNLQPGEYRFRVKAANRDGIWNEEGAAVRILITPPFWKTAWFRAITAALLLGIIFAGYEWRLRTIKAKKRELEARVQEKTAATEALQGALAEVERLKNRLQAENIYLQDEIRFVHNFENIITRSEGFKKILRSVEQVASTDATVLILGESGTGKELLARAIHNISPRGERPLVKVNCSALPANLIESELFGHEKGAFTGAICRKIGRFELADGGTIFLDEIGDLPPELQSKLLRVLQEGEFERLGNSQTLKVNVRVIAATNRDLEKALATGGFREDLYYRLNVFPITIPPLRERKEDIPLLVKHFAKVYGRKIGREIEAIPQPALEALQQYHWPGNVRELENIVERAVILSGGKQLRLGDWLPANGASHNGGPHNGNHISTLEESERGHILEALQATGWRVSGERGAAKMLGINPKTLESRMKKLKIHRP